MKCPKCSYVSFEYLDRCTNCGKELAEHKSEFGIDFIRYSSINILSPSKQNGGEDIGEDTAVAVAGAEEEAVADISTDTFSEKSDEEPAGDEPEDAVAEISLDE